MMHAFHAARRTCLAVLSIASLSCTAFESEVSEFPDAGPNGPDSLYAGIGQGIPFGSFALPATEFRAPHTGAVVPVTRDNVGSVLRSARDGRLRLVLNLAGSGNRTRNPDGTFNLAVWKARIDAYRDVDFAPYVTEGLILAHFLLDEPQADNTWGGTEVSRQDVEEMARYSKSIWPTLPTVVRAPPRWLGQGGSTYEHLDIAWAQWAGASHGAGTGRTPEEFRDENVSLAKDLGLGLVFGLNYLDGGDGSSGIGGTTPHPAWWQMSAAEVASVGTTLVLAPYACAFLSWRYDPQFERRPDVRVTLDSVAGLAAARGGTSCVRRDSLPPAGG